MHIGFGGQEGFVDTATLHRLDGPGFETQRGRDFPGSFRPASRPFQPLYNWHRVSFPEIKRLRYGA